MFASAEQRVSESKSGQDLEGSGLRPPGCRPGLREQSPEEGILGGCWASRSRSVSEAWLLEPRPPPSPSDRLAIPTEPRGWLLGPEKEALLHSTLLLILCPFIASGLSPGILHC